MDWIEGYVMTEEGWIATLITMKFGREATDSVFRVKFYSDSGTRMPSHELHLFAYELRHELEGRMGMRFCRQNSKSGLCDVEYGGRDSVWRAAMERRIAEAGGLPSLIRRR